MKILFVANTAWNIRNFRWGLVEAFRARGDEVLVAAPADHATPAIVASGVPFFDVAMDPASTNPLRDLALLRALTGLYREKSPDVVLHFTIKPNIYGGLAARRLRVPAIANVSGLGAAFQRPSLTQTAARLLYRAALAGAATVFFQNPDDRALFLEGRLVPEARARLLPGSGVDTARFAPPPPRPAGAPPVFLLVARMIREKGIGEYVEAARLVAARHPGAQFLMAGEVGVANPSAISREEIARWEAEGAVRYVGFSRDIREQIAAADCVVLPSYYREGVPRTLLEAASMGRPIITTDSVGCREAVDDGASGYLVRPRDAGDLADTLLRFLALGPRERAAMGEAGRRKALAQFDERIVVRSYLDAVDAAAAGRAPA
jgi:glycosyltransferase involved in cell wall biosynthesis